MANLSNVMRTEFAAAINQIATERKIDPEEIYEAIRQALVSAYRKQMGILDEEFYYFTKLNPETGESRIFSAPVLERDEETEEITKWDETQVKEVTPPGFGRIAAQTAKQVILQRIRRSEKDQIIASFQDKIGEMITGQVLRMDRRSVVVDLGRGHGWMPPEEQMRGEFYRLNSRIAVLIKDIRETPRGETVIVSRADKNLVAKLFEREVPEVASKAVEIVAIAREAGVRTKLAVRSTQEGVDPVGSCVGQRGVRVQKVIEELNNEKVDIIPHFEDMQLYVKGALAPAENLLVELDEKKKLITVTAPDDQLSLAIGRGGQNVRLAAKLLGYKITIKTAAGKVETQATGDEEYEIDTYDGLTDEAREILVQNKLTTLNDLVRFQDKWLAMEDLATDQKEILRQRVEQDIKDQAARDAAKEAMAKAFAEPVAEVIEETKAEKQVEEPAEEK
ncbi:MAG: transcription termination factor NusA [Candidatus Pacebacteria bacterium RIFOXYB1_FULL_39_46]|nr:MAG: transcription termination factor NusA [Candidatus Pacebacteria bacterium RIFOXYA1_FULL_38_18]OGJ38170.1 MAG: transcription termination factor NusA [Candidatus Pacebacteria bacterium RIFOXYB1_FULL_39_46]OGJ39609.1 MAG: transcription termination factor NusA [Candidatus Pacebacteria bacterium RIFOXYC1_FULL_39_21]OGJ39922.1 MAG: transcription termination factor NusA [Candidatus Pacebacteria bacterium RIFOXYD1_FULL_39_27]